MVQVLNGLLDLAAGPVGLPSGNWFLRTPSAYEPRS